MYIPIMKNRTQEMSVMSKFNNYFSDSIVPLIEIVKDYESRTSDNNENNVVTLSKLQNTLNGKRAFVEFFRYIDNEYQNTSIDIKGVKLAFDLSRDYFLYVQRMMEIKKFENFIPTISIKKGFILGHTDLEKLILDLKIENNPIAVRITDDVFDNYSSFLTILLDSNDYILLDLREQNIDARFMELTEFQNMKTAAKKILLNSPRLRELSNGEYEHLQFTDKIDNSCVEKYQAYNLDGFGDFGGLKDTLPRDGGPHGCALALIYCKKENKFFSARNDDSSLGVRGYRTTVPELLQYKKIYNPNNDCPVVQEIELNAEKGNYGNFPKWIYYTLARYIHQQATK